MKKVFKKIENIFWFSAKISGLLFLFFLLLALSDLPFWGRYYLGSYKSEVKHDPEYIVLMGAGGMPGPENYMRLFYAGLAAKMYENATIHIAIASWNPNDKYSPAGRMATELIKNNIDSSRIIYDTAGVNTFEQARNFSKVCDNFNTPILLVSSPEHIFRSVRTFEKLGFSKVYGMSSLETDVPEEHLLKKDRGEFTNSKLLNLRYNFWTQLKYEVVVARELIAIIYYKLSGKI